jgi:hypothetical protein
VQDRVLPGRRLRAAQALRRGAMRGGARDVSVDESGCAATGIVCGPASLECACFRTTVNAVRCGANMTLPDTECGECVNDQDCAEDHPDIPGVFCVLGGPSCACVGLSFCQAPCPQ